MAKLPSAEMRFGSISKECASAARKKTPKTVLRRQDHTTLRVLDLRAGKRRVQAAAGGCSATLLRFANVGPVKLELTLWITSSLLAGFR